MEAAVTGGRMLVDWVTYRAMGHAVEGLHVASAYAAADPDLAVSIVLNGRTPVELAGCCPWLAEVHAVDFDENAGALAVDVLTDLPRDWDWVLQEYRRRDTLLAADYPQVSRLAAAADAHYRPRRPGLPEHVAEHPLRLVLPAAAQDRASDIVSPGNNIVISVLPAGGGSPSRFPSHGSWMVMLSELRAAWPQAVIVLLGKTQGDHQRRASAMTGQELDHLAEANGAVNARDLPLLVQLALVERSRMLFSPHSGFGFAALAVATPWLTLSGGPYFEYFHIGTPFYSLLPDTTRYPAFTGDRNLIEDSDGSGPREPTMTRQRVTETLPHLLAAADLLINNELSYEDCLADYFPRLLTALGGDHTRMASWEKIHHRYV